MSTGRRRIRFFADVRLIGKWGRTLNRWPKDRKSVSTPGGSLPRRLISSSVAACIKSNSPSLKCLTALRKFLGRICRCGALSGVAFGVLGFRCGGEASRTTWRPRTGRASSRSAGWRPMPKSCRHRRRTAILRDGNHFSQKVPEQLRRDSHQKFAEILPAQEADEGARRVLQPLDDVFAILDPAFADAGGDIVHEIPRDRRIRRG